MASLPDLSPADLADSVHRLGCSPAQNYPNPFNPTTTIRFALPGEMHVTLNIYDARGERVRTLIDGVRPEGLNSVIWNADNDKGQSVSTGVYFYKFSAGSFSDVRKMILLQ